MNNDLDPTLLAMFDAAKAEPLDGDFVDELMARVDRERHRSLSIWLIAAALSVVVVWLLVGPVSATLDMVGQLLPASLVQFESKWLQQLLSPINSVAAALAVGILLVRRFWRGLFR